LTFNVDDLCAQGIKPSPSPTAGKGESKPVDLALSSLLKPLACVRFLDMLLF